MDNDEIQKAAKAITKKSNFDLEKINVKFEETMNNAMASIFEDKDRAVELFEEIRGRWESGDTKPSTIRELSEVLKSTQEPTKMLVELASVLARLKAVEGKIQINTLIDSSNTTNIKDYESVIDMVDKMIEEKSKKEKIIDVEVDDSET